MNLGHNPEKRLKSGQKSRISTLKPILLALILTYHLLCTLSMLPLLQQLHCIYLEIICQWSLPYRECQHNLGAT